MTTLLFILGAALLLCVFGAVFMCIAIVMAVSKW